MTPIKNPAENKRILIVDDNVSIHEDFRKALSGDSTEKNTELNKLEGELFGSPNDGPGVMEPSEYAIDSAYQGREALTMVEKFEAAGTPYALVFMDMRMPPGWNGLETIKRIWQVAPHLEVVICTAYSDHSSEEIITNLGITDRLLFIKKPFDRVTVRQMALTLTTKWNLEKLVKKHVAELEGLVAERTAKLEESLGKLTKANKDLDENLTLLKTTQAQIMSVNKMSALGEMAGGIAHEINTPLAVIHTLSGQLIEIVNENTINKEVLIDAATTIETTVLRIAKIVSGLRAFSRDGSGEPYETKSVKSLIDETVVFCRERFTSYGVPLTIDPIPEHLSLSCRFTEISQVLLNLLNNAFDAIAPLRDKWVTLSVTDQGPNIEISVTDSGPGVSPEVQQKMFQPFFTTKGIGKGTGLGLSISKGLIESHSGELFVDQKCSNTRFVIRLKKSNLATPTS